MTPHLLRIRRQTTDKGFYYFHLIVVNEMSIIVLNVRELAGGVLNPVVRVHLWDCLQSTDIVERIA